MRNVPRLTKAGFEIFGEEALKTARVNRTRPTISFNVTSGLDWFDVDAAVNFGDIEVSIKEVRKALRKKEHYIKLADGSIGEIPQEWLERYKHLFDLGEETKQGVRLSNFHLTLLDELLSESDSVRTDQEFQERLQRLKNFTGLTLTSCLRAWWESCDPIKKLGWIGSISCMSSTLGAAWQTIWDWERQSRCWLSCFPYVSLSIPKCLT